MIAQITDYVVENVFREMGAFLAANPSLYISINLSASDFHSSRLIALIANKARQYGVLAQQIKVEVTERGFIDVPKTTPVIQAFRQAGYEVAIDDFGTGYSNLHNLYSLKVDILKIDKSFIDTLTTNQHQPPDRGAYYRYGPKPAAENHRGRRGNGGSGQLVA